MTVTGYVWGAHRVMVEAMGDAAPAYEWCEAAARCYGLARLCADGRGGVDHVLAASHLRVFLANGWLPPDQRPPRIPAPVQLGLAL